MKAQNVALHTGSNVLAFFVVLPRSVTTLLQYQAGRYLEVGTYLTCTVQ